MIEIYLMTSLAPIPFATSVNREVGHMGHNYFKSLFAVGFQGMLIMVCVAIYAKEIQQVLIELYEVFDFCSVEEAADYFENWQS